MIPSGSVHIEIEEEGEIIPDCLFTILKEGSHDK